MTPPAPLPPPPPSRAGMNKQIWSPSYLFFMAGSVGDLVLYAFSQSSPLQLYPRGESHREGCGYTRSVEPC